MCEVYRRLAELEKDPVRRQTLVRIMHDERRHCAILKRRTGREMAPDPKRVFWYVWIMRVLGPAFVVRQMELCEKARRRVIPCMPSGRSSFGSLRRKSATGRI